MCELACNEASTWLMVDPWEAIQPDYQPTAVVLDHIAYSINTLLGGISGVPAKIMLLGGSDLLQTMSQPGVWSPADLAHILGDYGLLVIERNGADIGEALAPLQQRWQGNIWIVRQLIANDISSTRIRQLIRQGMSVRYLLPGVVVDYIREHRLYGEHEEFRETRSSSMPPLCRADGKCACVPGAAAAGVGLRVPGPAQMVRCVSAQRERVPSKMREEMSADGEADEGTQTEEEDTRGRRPSS
jgi:nicotinamide mononucleotide adenylyltransferase